MRIRFFKFWLIFIFCFGCQRITEVQVLDDFSLGKVFNSKDIEHKLGLNVLRKYDMAFSQLGKNVSFYGVGNNIWEYNRFQNGPSSFIHFKTTDNIISEIVVIVGKIEQMFPNQKGADDWFTIKETCTIQDINYLSSYLKFKFGNTYDSSGIFNNPNLRFLTWRFKDYDVEFCFDDVSYQRCFISYTISFDAQEILRKRASKTKK